MLIRFFLCGLVSSLLLPVNAQDTTYITNPHHNVVISTTKSPNEPTIAMHPKDPNLLMAGANIDNLYTSNDGGKTWATKTLRSTYGVWGDPVIVADTAGDFYFFHLSNPPNGSWIDRIVCQKSTDHGKSWTNGSYTGLNGKKAQDKHWVAVDPATNALYVTWTQFDKYKSRKSSDKSSIMFSKSVDGGKTWTTAQKINQVDGDCLDGDNTTEGAVPAVGPNGEVYVAWAGPKGLMFDRSLDGGKTWLDEDVRIDPMPTGWDYGVPGIYRANGLPITACDRTGGTHHGTIYVNWSDQRNGANDTDVWLAKSTDQGKTWSAPIRVNNDGPDHHQFFTWMSIDPTTGYLYFVFYDRRGLKGAATNVYLARSTDGGASFVNVKINNEPFEPNSGIFFGDYNNIVAHGTVVRPIWTRLDGEVLSVKTALIDVAAIPAARASTTSRVENKGDQKLSDTPMINAPIYVSFKLHKTTKLRLVVYDADGRKCATVFRRKRFAYGKHIQSIDAKALKLATGNYTYRLYAGVKLIQERSFDVP